MREKSIPLIQLEERKKNYFKNTICHRLVAYSDLNELYWYGPKYVEQDKHKDKNFVKKIKRGPKGESYKKAEKPM